MFEPPEFDPNSKAKLIAITFDEASIRRGSSNIEHEREVAVFDILEGNRFALDGRDGGPYTLNLSIVEDRLVFAVAQEGSDDTFTDQPAVANAASELLQEIFGDDGKHVRSAVGVNTLPRDGSVEIEFIFQAA